ncbi:opioid-binding protein/cell adhesion molecule-like [Trichoplusia ni]|uniref:Hemolin n=1 Tax=Trichoplusia ni TaxID=7111 RepID=A0A7E5WUP1_TRINI|nr:opioid-binding protein/cell adhesion molecule-like [Trichoplusia ni]
MEIRRSMFCLALVLLAVLQCSESHSMRRRQAVDDVNYDDPLLGDEATDDETLNDTDNAEVQPEKAPAVIETKPTHYEVEADGEIRLECKVSPENTVVQWYKGNQLYFIGNINLHPEEVRYSIAEDSKDLLIKNAKLSDSDVFKCETVQKSLLAINHTLLVTQKPEIINMSASHGGNLAVGADLKLTCLVTASPVPTVIWSVTRRDNNQNDRLTEKDGEFSVEGNVYSMYIKNVRKSDAGQYYCYALNKLGSHQAEITVVVNGKPQVHVPRTIVNSGLNTEAILQCSAHEEARPHIRWYKDGSLIENSSSKFMISTRGSHSNLTVFPSADEDFGTYTCEAANSFGRHNKSIDLVQSPVVEDLEVDGSAMTWVVHSHQPLEAMEVQLRPLSDDGEWTSLDVPLPPSNGHKYEVSYHLEDKQLDSGEYHAVVKVKNSKSWGGSDEPAVVKIEAQAQYIQHASVFRENNAAHSIRPVYTAITTVLMYLLVRMV